MGTPVALSIKLPWWRRSHRRFRGRPVVLQWLRRRPRLHWRFWGSAFPLEGQRSRCICYRSEKITNSLKLNGPIFFIYDSNICYIFFGDFPVMHAIEVKILPILFDMNSNWDNGCLTVEVNLRLKCAVLVHTLSLTCLKVTKGSVCWKGIYFAVMLSLMRFSAI